MSLKIALVCPFDPEPDDAEHGRAHVGGVERVFSHLSRQLARRGHEVTVVCSTDGKPGTRRERGMTLVRVRRRGTLMRSPIVDLSAHLPKDADVVHVPATYPFTTPRVIRAARARKQPVVLDFHFEPAPGTLVGRAAAMAYRQVGPRSYPLADAVIVRSRAYGATSRSLRRVPADRWRIIPNGIDTDRFRPRRHDAGPEFLLFVGRLVPYKGLDVLLHALCRRPAGMTLKIVGDGPLRRELETLATRLRVPAEFLGHVADAELPRLYSNARLTVLPSVTAQEAFGISLLESMACGTPVVASELPGVAEVARLGGLTAQPRDPDALGRAIHEALDAPLPRGATLAERVRDTYSWDAVTDRVLDVYREVTSARATRRHRTEVKRAARPVRQPVL